ncbi:MAG: sulfatase [Planctomycetes bacterium]|nr:sulfatase [Planctomycetota bacterium]
MPEAVPGPAPRAFYSEAAPLCAAWLGLSGLHLLLSRLLPGTELREPSTPSWIHLGLVSTELCGAALILALGWGLGALARRLRLARTARVLPFVLAAGLVFGVAASWFSFYNLGQFADLRGMEFAWVNGSLFLAYVHATHPEALFLLPFGALAVSSAAVWYLPRLLRRVPPPRLERGVRIVLGLAAFCVLCMTAVELFRGFDDEGTKDYVTGVVHPWGRMYEVRREAVTGPLTHAMCGVFNALAPGASLPEVRRESSQVLRRPQVRLEDYAASVDRASFRPRNVVLVLVDSLRPDHLEKGGAARSVMPNVDDLVRGGRFFADARTEASHTDYAAICPLSAQYPLRSAEVHRYPENPPYPRVLIYDVLKALGYRTALVSSQDEHWGRMMNYLKTGGLDLLDHPYRAESRNMLWNFRLDDATVDRAIQWLGEESAKPFFLYLNLQNAHFPYVVPEGWPRKYGKKPDFRMVMGMYPHDRVGDVRNLYADALDFVDAQIGKVVGFLKERKLWEETIFIVIADHGEAFREHQFGGHGGKIFEEVMKVPIIFRGPGVEPGVDARPAELIDVPVSLCRLLGIPSHPSFQGTDLFAADPPKERSRFMVCHTPLATQLGVERGGWKLIYDEPLKLPALYDLRRDPGETTDVSAARPAIQRELMRQLTEWRSLQLRYYVDPERLSKEYPPVLLESRR